MFDHAGNAGAISLGSKHPSRVFRDSTNRLISSNKLESVSKPSGLLRSHTAHYSNAGKQISSGSSDNNPQTSHKAKTLQRQSSKSSVSSRSASSRQRDPLDDVSVTIEEIRTSSNGTKSIHKYIRGRFLGKGGFAKVYLCTSLDTQKNYAVKIVPKANLVKSRARQKLQAEIKIHRILKNKRICEFKHFFEDRKNCYILLELCPNQTLNELLKRRKRLTELEVMYFMNQLIHGVQYIHRSNVIHRDLKLGNLFLDKNMGIKIGDLGLAVKLGKASEKRTTICGTPNYIAPEVIDCLNGGQRGHSFEVDVWAIGVIMFASLVGKPPYEARDVKSTYKRILNNEYSFPSKLSISRQAKDLITGMLQSNPEHRPSLDQVASHSFFANKLEKLPLTLSSKCTRIAPIWREDGNGHFVAEFPQIEGENTVTCASKDTAKAKIGETRQPLKSMNSNALKDERGQEEKGKLYQSNALRSRSSKIQDSFGSGLSKKTCRSGLRNCSGSKNIDECSNVRPQNTKFTIFTDMQQPESEDSTSQIRPYLRESDKPFDDMTNEVANLKLSKPRQEKTIPVITQYSGSSNLGMLPNENKNLKVPESIETRNGAYNQIDDVMKNVCGSKAADVLETMHSRLEKSFNVKEQGDELEDGVLPQKIECSPVWVSRYVDYTSKYGLGFILNDGSSGVYFNDSTKIVLAPEGDIFQYIERRKATSNKKECNQEMEPTIHIYSLTSYPEHLQKKVTLLQHFRNYLIEQQKTSGESILQKPLTPRKKPETESSANSISPYVYLKKWVRTRHAILFRLSNCTVQVVFYDHTEVLLSSEARLVTYVDKSGLRTTFPIHEITKNPNGEVGKRLKYAKDILQQLISGAK